MSFGIAELLSTSSNGDFLVVNQGIIRKLSYLKRQNFDNPEFAKEYIACFPDTFKDFSEKVKNDYEVVIVYLENNTKPGSIYKPEWVKDKRCLELLLPKFPQLYKHVEDIDNPKFVRAAAKGLMDNYYSWSQSYSAVLQYLRIFIKSVENWKREDLNLLIKACDDLEGSIKWGNKIQKVPKDVGFYFLNSALNE